MNVVSTLIEAHVFRKMENDLEFLLLKRSANEFYPNIWQMVTGFIEPDEKAFETALREIKEETCLSPERFWVVPKVNSFYNAYKNEVCMVPVFAALVKNDSVIKISEEHSEYTWVDKERAKQLLAWPGQRDAVDIIYNYFTAEQSLLTFVEINL